MADDAFALSPISARAAQPSEADYDAIQEAFMETSRGRWFLGEYAKRNRNADTKMVLDAVSRIEETISAQKKPVRDPLLDEAMAALRAALADARGATTAALGDLALEQNLAPVRKGARVIREIAWRLREIGADGRICDLIDSQVAAIEGATAKLSPADLVATLSGAFDRIEGKIATLDADEAVAAGSPPAAAPPEARTETPTGPLKTPEASHAAPEAATEAKAEITPEINAAAANPAAANESAPAAASEIASEPADAFDSNDEALLDRVAMEMAAFDTDEAYEPKLEDIEASEGLASESQVPESHASETRASENNVHDSSFHGDQPRNGTGASLADQMQAEAPVGSWEIDVTFKSDVADERDAGETAPASVAATALPIVMPLQSAPEPEPKLVPASAASASAPSLGSSLLANGIVSRPRASGPDPLAPIRRMTQSEKIAFFS
jgi:hypothetical protein